MEFSVIVSAFFLVFFAELGDKTQLMAFSLSGGRRSVWPVFAGSSAALVLSTLIAVCVGGELGKIGPAVMQPVAGGVLIGFGLYTLWPKKSDPVRDFFLALLQLEKLERRFAARQIRKDPEGSAPLQRILADGTEPFALFRSVLRRKLLQGDDIGALESLRAMTDSMQQAADRLPAKRKDALRRLAELEQMTITACGIVLSHLQAESHHDTENAGPDAELVRILREIIIEEEVHAAIFHDMAGGCND